MACLSAEADMGDSTLNLRRRWLHCINNWEEASSIEESCTSRSSVISPMFGDIVESLLKIGGIMALEVFALRGTVITIDVNEGDINSDTKGRCVSSLAHFNDRRLGRRGPPGE